MTGHDIYNRCMALLGYTAAENEAILGKTFLGRMPEIINQIAADLKLSGVETLDTEIDATAAKTDALCYGCTMLLALSENDGAKNQLFANIYNAKRSAALGHTATIEDVLPSTVSGGI
ncbi:MAG: hypothetical protein UHO61_02985 [Acutalibacteraceae bacterium]|nr:hypothetical protein [Acutalibacteraceae bacterium]